jgi:hypothetical protein
MSQTLGFSVACYQGDIPLLRGCLASIRHFAPDAPICLIADGDFSTREFERAYGVQVIRRNDVRHPGLRKWSFGYGITKMVALWESPFEWVFHLDNDLVLWGDIRKNLPEQPWDFVYNEPHEVITDEIQKSQYFDPEKLFQFVPEFPWQERPYFNTGSWCARRGQFDLDEYLTLLEVYRKHPGVVFADQGILGIMAFRAASANRMKVQEAHLQTIVPVCTKKELETHFAIDENGPILAGRPTAIHWAGPKPWTSNRELFREPMDYFRKKSAANSPLLSKLPPESSLAVDEWIHREAPRKVASAKAVIKRLIGKR